MKTTKLGLRTITLTDKKDPTAFQLARREGKDPIKLWGTIIIDVFLLIGGASIILPAIGLSPHLKSFSGFVGMAICTYGCYWTFKRMEREHG